MLLLLDNGGVPTSPGPGTGSAKLDFSLAGNSMYLIIGIF